MELQTISQRLVVRSEACSRTAQRAPIGPRKKAGHMIAPNLSQTQQARFLKRRDVRLWHKADMSCCTAHVRFGG